ncbi:uncharacterized protein CBL_05333 [Carabus blaptoides fortunei]
MILFTIALLVLSLVPGYSATSLQYKIIGGIEVSIVQCPHQVSVRVNDSHRCGGSILDANTVLTAAHCVYNINFFSISVRIGSSNNKNGKSIKVKQMFIHPYYNRPRFNNDVAILKLQENLVFSAAVQPIALQPPGAEVRPGTRALVCGWGDIYEGSGTTPDILRVADVTVLSDFECTRIYGPRVFTRRNPVPELDGRIVGGSQVSIEDYPYQVSVRIYDYHVCGGSILDEATVLTAAHCVYGMNPSTFSVRVGNTAHADGESVKVSRVTINRDYDSNTADYDMAILKLATSLVFNNSIQPIPLQPKGVEVPAGTEAWVSGWGVTSEDSITVPALLRAVNLTVITNTECSNKYSPILISPHMTAS